MSNAKSEQKGNLLDEKDFLRPRPKLPRGEDLPVQSDDLAPFLNSLVRGDRDACWRISDGLLQANPDVLSLYQGLFQPALYRVGELWAANQISVATEHVATAITEQMMNRIYPRVIAADRCGRKVVVGLVEGERHQVGAKMVADVFEMHGWDAVFAGTGCSIDELLQIVERQQADLLALSCSIFEHFDILEHMLERTRERCPDLPVVLGGQGFQQAGPELESRFPNVSLGTLEDLIEFIAAFGNEGKPTDDGDAPKS